MSVLPPPLAGEPYPTHSLRTYRYSHTYVLTSFNRSHIHLLRAWLETAAHMQSSPWSEISEPGPR